MKIYYDNKSKLILPDGKLNTEIYEIYNKNTFVFITRKNYEILHPQEEKGVGLLDDTSALTPDEMLELKILYCVMNLYSDKEIVELLKLVKQYKGSVVKHVVIK